MIQLTTYYHPLKAIKTVDGEITWEQYLFKEAKRINADPLRKAEIRQLLHNKLMALFVNCPPGHSCDQCKAEINGEREQLAL